MKKISKNPFFSGLLVLIATVLLTLPIMLFSEEKTIIFSLIVAIIYFTSTTFIHSFFKKSFEEATLYNKKHFKWILAIFVILVFLTSLSKKDYSQYFHSDILYCCYIFASTILLMIANIVKNRGKNYAKVFYIISIVFLYYSSAIACLSLFKIGEQWIFW